MNASRLQQKACSEDKGKASSIDSPNWPMATCSALWTKPIPPRTSAARSLIASSGREGAHTANRPESTGKGETTNLNCRPPSQKQKRSYQQLIWCIVGSRKDIQASQFCQKKEQKAWKKCTHTTAVLESIARLMKGCFFFILKTAEIGGSDCYLKCKNKKTKKEAMQNSN